VQIGHQLRLNGIGAGLGDFLRGDRRATESKSSYYPQSPHVPPCLCWQQFYYGALERVWQNRRSLHCAPPDFLLRVVALINCMRFPLRETASVALASAAK
jgi:hypothetical protein